MKKRLFLILFILTGIVGLFSQNSDDKIINLEDYDYALTSSPEKLPSDSDWSEIDLPSKLPPILSEGKTTLWIKTEIPGSTHSSDLLPVLNAGKVKNAMAVYMNGQLLHQSGFMSKDFHFPRYRTRRFQLPQALLNKAGSNELMIQYYSPMGDFSGIPQWKIEDYYVTYKLHILSDFFNVEMYLAFSFLSLFISIYFILQYIYNRKNYPALWFSLANLFLTFYFGEMGLMVDVLPPVLSFILAKACLTPFFLFLTLFILDYFKIFNKAWIRYSLLASQSLVILLYILKARNYSSTMDVFTIGLMPAGIWLIFMAVIMVKAIKAKNREALIIGIGVAFGIGAAVYDFAFTFMGKEPFVWLQGPGIVLFDISIFITQALGAIKNHMALQKYTTDMEEQKAGLTSLLREVTRSSGALSSISQKLDNNIKQSIGSLESLNESSNQISGKVEEQFSLTESAGKDVKNMLSASEEVYKRLDNQTEEFSQTSGTLQEMILEIDQITQGLQQITQSGSELESLATDGESAMRTSSKSMDEIKQVSLKVFQVVDAMNDIADRTNLLSMNASIEAAHAGNSGRGFAVVAQEIKKLAEASSSRAAEVIQEINLIRDKIEEGVVLNQQVNKAFQVITGKTRETIKHIAQIYQSMEHQRQASQTIMASVQTLTRDSKSLHDYTDEQKKMSEHLEEGVNALINSSKEMHQGIQRVFQELHSVTTAAEGIKSLSEESKNEAMVLESMTD